MAALSTIFLASHSAAWCSKWPRGPAEGAAGQNTVHPCDIKGGDLQYAGDLGKEGGGRG